MSGTETYLYLASVTLLLQSNIFLVYQDFRRRLKTSRKSLSTETVQTLRVELHFILQCLSPGTSRSNPHEDETNEESFEDYLKRLIDNRLALRLSSDDQANSTKGSRDIDAIARSN